MHISKMNIGRFLQNKTEKGKQFEISLKMNCIDFEVWPVNRRFFVQETDVLVRERFRTI